MLKRTVLYGRFNMVTGFKESIHLELRWLFPTRMGAGEMAKDDPTRGLYRVISMLILVNGTPDIRRPVFRSGAVGFGLGGEGAGAGLFGPGEHEEQR
jgi:hypothetical protein